MSDQKVVQVYLPKAQFVCHCGHPQFWPEYLKDACTRYTCTRCKKVFETTDNRSERVIKKAP